MEKRSIEFNTSLNVRDEGSSKMLEGYFIKFNEETELYRGVFEEIAPSAVVKSLKNNDIQALFNHNEAIVLGRTGNSTLQLKADNVGLWGSVLINPDDREANDIYARVKRGDINKCSFGFYPEEEDIQDRTDGGKKFVVRDANIIEVSIVSRPAYDSTSINARARELRKAQLKEHNVVDLNIRKQDLIKKMESRYEQINNG